MRNRGVQLDEIFEGDALEYARKVENDSVHLVVTSPPYNIGKEYESRVRLDDYLSLQKEIIREVFRSLRTDGSVFWQVGSYPVDGQLIPLDLKLYPLFEELGFRLMNRIVWIRQHGQHAKRKFSPRHETILWFTKGENYRFQLDPIRVPQKYPNKKHYRGDKKGELSCNPAGKNPGDVWLFQNVKHNHEERTLHPCQFPEDMIARIILATTEPGQIVYDPYMGSGTVAIVAGRLGRHYIGSEIDPGYGAIARRRLTGKPDSNNCFPNLKTLRDFVEQTGNPIEQFRFDVQVGKRASSRKDAKIYPEDYHKNELMNRLEFEESAFVSKMKEKPGKGRGALSRNQ